MDDRRPDDVAPEELVRGEPREAQVKLLLDEPPQALVAVDDAQQQLPQPRRVADDERVAAWYAPRDESERLGASAPPPPVPRADVSRAAGGGSGTFSAHPFELRERAQHPQQAANWNRGCPYGADPEPAAAAAKKQGATPVSLKSLLHKN